MADIQNLRRIFTSIKEELDEHCGTNVTAEDMLWLLDQLEAEQRDCATMRSALEAIASGEITREYCHGPHCVEELGIATADELSSRAAGALSFIDMLESSKP